jgi:hypothetical protein
MHGFALARGRVAAVSRSIGAEGRRLARERDLPFNESGDKDYQVPQPPCTRQGKTYLRVQTEHSADQSEAALLYAQRTRYEKRDTAQRPNQ